MLEYATAKTSVWWDIENCGVPRTCDAQLIVQNMSSALAAAGYRGAISVSAYGDTHKIARDVQHALSSTGVSLHHVPAGIKDASDKKILVDMLFWALDNPPPANYLLISGDRDFSNAIHKLKMRRYNILLAQPSNVSQTLTVAAKNVWLWKSLVAGEPPLAQSPYISSTSSGYKGDLDKSKNIVSSSLGVSLDTKPEGQNIVCDPQTDPNGKADKKYEVVSKPTRIMQKKRSNPGGCEFTEQASFKKSKGDFHSTDESKLKQPKKGRLKAAWRKGRICFKCGDRHRAFMCNFNGDCDICGKPGHKDLVCKQNPNRIVKWVSAYAQDLVTSSPWSVQITSSASHPTCLTPSGCVRQATPGVPSPSPTPPVAPAPPHAGDGFSSGPAPSGVNAMPTAVEVGREDLVQLTTSMPCPPMTVPAYRPSQGQGIICLKCGVVGHHSAKCTYVGVCCRCGQGHMERVCKENPDRIIKWEQVPAYRPRQGQRRLCLKCGVVGHRAAKCTYIGVCRHCGKGHMERVCKENPDSIIKWEQVHEYALATSSQGLVHMAAPASQLPQTWTPPPGSLWQATPAVTTPSLAPAAPAPPHMGVAASSAPVQSEDYATLTVVPLSETDVLMQPRALQLTKQSWDSIIK